MTDIDRRSIVEFGIPEAALMERAGEAVAKEIARRWRGRPVDVLCGPGRNGGDGLVVARLAGGRAIPLGEKWSPAPHAVIVDALFGTGLNRDIEGPARLLIEAVNALDRSDHPVISVDIPSGLDADTGAPRGIAVRASVTVTMGLPKRGFLAPDAAPFVGELVVADIGHPRQLVGSS